MAIPVRNIYYLLLYAWGHFKPGGINNVGAVESPDLPNLLSKVLNDSAHRLLRRGLDRGYVDVTEETRSPRGKLRLDLITKQQTLLRGIAVCDVDDLTSDVPHNQILKATLVSLANCADVDSALQRDLLQTAKRMMGVSPIRLSANAFRRVQLSRNLSHYDFLMRLCELVFHSLLPDEHGTGSKFQSIVEDEVRMPALFEEFLRNFYRTELTGYAVGSEIMSWHAEAENDDDLAYLPVMKTDITLRSAERTIIADAKYYKAALTGGRFSAKIHASHLYQLATYLEHANRKQPEVPVSGLLIYPANGHSFRMRYRILDTPVLIATVNLAADWKTISEELLELMS